MKRQLSRLRLARFAYAALLAFALLLSCGLTALAVEESSLDLSQTAVPPINTSATLLYLEELATEELYPTDVQAIIGDSTRQIV